MQTTGHSAEHDHRPPPLPGETVRPAETATAETSRNTQTSHGRIRGYRQTRALSVRDLFVGGLAGFVLGIAFWHAVGFWGFVSDAVLGKPSIAAIEPRTSTTFLGQHAVGTRMPTTTSAPIETGSITTGSISRSPVSPVRAVAPIGRATPIAATGYPTPPSADVETCTALVRDKATGTTRKGACDADREILAEVPTHGREDRQPPTYQNNWSTAVEATTGLPKTAAQH